MKLQDIIHFLVNNLFYHLHGNILWMDNRDFKEEKNGHFSDVSHNCNQMKENIDIFLFLFLIPTFLTLKTY